MKIGELMSAFALRKWKGLENDEAAGALADDYRQAGIHDGPLLHDAWDRCRVDWTKTFSPRASEFREYYRTAEQNYNKPVSDPGDSRFPDIHKWAGKLLAGPFGHDAMLADPPYCRELVTWAKRFQDGRPVNAGKMPSPDDVMDMRRNSAAFADSMEKLKRGQWPDGSAYQGDPAIARGFISIGQATTLVAGKTANLMAGMEYRAAVFHREHCPECFEAQGPCGMTPEQAADWDRGESPLVAEG